MALALLCGHPCSGKTSLSQQLQAALVVALQERGSALTVQVIEEATFIESRASSYKGTSPQPLFATESEAFPS